jgi:hypothetical protein
VFFIKNWIEGTPNRGKSLHFTFVTIEKEKPAVFAAGFECLKPEGPALSISLKRDRRPPL